MFYALVHNKINMQSIEVSYDIMDIEELNNCALDNIYDVTKCSVAILPEVNNNYYLLSAGSTFGLEGGTLLITKKPDFLNIVNSTIVCPGKHTTAYLLLKKFYSKKFNIIHSNFSSIIKLLNEDKADAGVVIHEDRFLYRDSGFTLIQDLGQEWIFKTGTPVPLGIIIVSQKINQVITMKFNEMLFDSILYAYQNFDEVLPFVLKHAQKQSEKVVKQHILYYVNIYSLMINELLGEKAINYLLSDYQKKLYLPEINCGFYKIV